MTKVFMFCPIFNIQNPFIRKNHEVIREVADCEVNYFEANNVFVDENVNIEYSCSSAVDVNIMIFDSKGNPLLPSPHQTNCDLIKQVYDEFVFTEVQKIAIVTIQTENCVKEKIFTVKSKVRSAIPDNNLFLVLFIVIIVSIILVKKKD